MSPHHEKSMASRKKEGVQDNWVVFELLEMRFDIIGMHGNVMTGEGNLLVLYMDEEVGHSHAK